MRAAIWAILGAALALGAAGCDTQAFCFDCTGGEGGNGKTDGGPKPTGAGGGDLTSTGSNGDGGLFNNPASSGVGGAGGSGECTPTNGGTEICDGVDNDCNGLVDDGIDFTNPKTCGTCDNNCYAQLINNDPASIKCKPSPNPGLVPGTCQGSCAQDYFDVDKDGLACEYYCVQTAENDKLCNNQDDDCDGLKDEDVDLCTSTDNCGKCGGKCSVVHGTPACVHAGGAACDPSNTQCQIKKCDCTGPGDCWWDLDNSVATGCEYKCDLTNGGVEICDGLDNDCDGKIDGADDLSKDPKIGVVCHGSMVGECGAAAHAGVTACVAQKVVCSGPDVIFEGQQPELCNGKDDDCDGQVDDSPSDAGGSCGASNIFPCAWGKWVCSGGKLSCVGAIDPGTETCNGQDDDCDGTIDDSPSDAVGTCNVPTPPPAGATSPCKAGQKQCVGGTVACVGAVGPTAPSDTCGVDANCDGKLTNQPDTQTDLANCGACGNSCLAGAVHANWSCQSGQCKFQGCQAGFYDLDGDNKCEYACTFVSAQEACNGQDDNCNGQVDEGVKAPSPTQVCGVSPSATGAECTSGVTVACQNGNWKCTFPAGVCSPSCGATADVCDNLDNNCNGLLNEGVPNYGKPCASDDGLPPPGHGACKTTGTYVCNGANATKCSAVKASCANLPGGCTETCDGVDNDCDGLIDEPFSNKGDDPANYVKPAVTKIAAGLWIMSYEASRPNATSNAPGTGNGYRCAAFDANDPNCNDNNVPLAPAGVTLEKTAACSVASRIPWFNATPIEAEQTCKAMGGKLCSTADWQSACQATVPCKWGYAPRGNTCTSKYVANTKYCNLGTTFDFDPNTLGTQSGLLVTGSSSLKNCFADWSALQGNVASNNKVFDITGNLREITKQAANQYPLMGGAFNSQDENGATCDFSFYTVDASYQLYDLGFRCCFAADPTQ